MNHIHCEHIELSQGKRWLATLLILGLGLVILRPFFVSGAIRRGDGYLGYGMHKDAIREYRKALLLSPTSDRAHNWLGYAYKQSGRTKEAIAVYLKALTINSENIIAGYDLGMIYTREKDFARAEAHLTKAAAILSYPELTNEEFLTYKISSLRLLAFCQKRLGKEEEAILSYKRALEISPEDE